MNKKSHLLTGFLMGLFFLACGAVLAARATAPIKIKVTAELANIRQKPSIGSVIIRQFPQGEILDAVRLEGEWYLVKLEPDESGATSGYVHQSLVMPLEDVPAQEIRPRLVEPPAKKEPVRPPVVRPQRAEAETPAPAVADAGPAGAGRISLLLFGGGSLAAGGDLNTGAQGLADLYAGSIGVAGDTRVAPAKLSALYGGDLAFPIASGLFITAGAEFFKASKETLVTYAKSGAADKFTARPGFQGFPLKLGMTYYPAEFIYVRLGVSYYFAKATYFYRYEHDTFWQEWQGEATGQGLGFWGGLGLEWALSGSLAFVFETTGQFATISGFNGTGTLIDSAAAGTVTEQGTLYAFDSRTSNQKIYPVVFIRNKVPAEAGVENAREATVNFSGIAIRAGFKIKF
jgi:hypothetical protein